MAASEGPGAVTGVIETMTGYAEAAYQIAETTIASLTGSISEVVFELETLEVPEIEPSEEPPEMEAELDLEDVPEVEIVIPDLITISEFNGSLPDILDPSGIVFDPPMSLDFPTNTAVRPVYDPTPPTPNTKTYDIPTAPSITLPPDPVLEEIVIPDFVDVEIVGLTVAIPLFDGTVPNLIPLDGAQFDNRLDNETASALHVAARDKIADIIINGGTLLNPDVEADIWQRDLERHEQALQDAIDKLTEQWAKLGWTLPDGLLASQMLALNNEYMNKKLDRSREIAIKQADLEQAGTLKALELGVSWENMIFSTLNEFVRRRIDVAKYNSDTLVEIFKQEVVMYNTGLETFKADVEGYKARITAELARISVFKEKINGQMAIAQVNESLVKAYIARLSGVEATVNLYNAQLKGVALMYEAEKQKIDVFRATVEGYSAKTDALTKRYLGEIEAFKGAVQGTAAKQGAIATFSESLSRFNVAQFDAEARANESKVKRYTAEVDAYVGEVKAAVAKSEANNANVDAQSKANVARFNALITKYDAAVKYYVAQVDAYKGTIQAFVATQGVKDTNAEVQSRVVLAVYDAQVKRIEAETRLKEITMQTRVEALKGAAQAASNLAAGAMSSIHASVSAAYGDSVSESHTYKEK
jgi:hypothetical protein